MPFVLLIAMLFLALPSSLCAGELNLLGGGVQETDPRHRAAAWTIKYVEGLSEHVAADFFYLNQGHLTDHHRDGHGLNLLLRSNLFDRQLSLMAGGGPFFFYDTVSMPGLPSRDAHGWGAVVSLGALWYAENRWIYQLQTNWVKAFGGFDTVSVLAGIGYQLDPPASPGPLAEIPPSDSETEPNEISLLVGQATVNIPGDGDSPAVLLEYRRQLWRFLEGSVGFMYEGKNNLTERYGIETQLWLAKRFFDARLTLGVGGGGYIAADHRRLGHAETFAEMFTLAGSWKLLPAWHLKGSWNRIITRYDRDADIFLMGAGYRF